MWRSQAVALSEETQERQEEKIEKHKEMVESCRNQGSKDGSADRSGVTASCGNYSAGGLAYGAWHCRTCRCGISADVIDWIARSQFKKRGKMI